ncbi:MAG: hypothetical protein KGQ37_05150 [Hyphomicrobiales bacterium]|nr:hypothetical protein [Hyphomicrobiales bacterium]
MAQSSPHTAPSPRRAEERGFGPTTREPLKILLLEDDPNDEIIIRHCLKQSRHFDCDVTSCNQIADARHLLATSLFDVLVLDFWVNAEDSLSLLARGADAPALPPSVVVSSLDMTDIQAQSLSAGALAYLHKNDVSASALDATLRTLLHTRSRENQLRQALESRSNAAEKARDEATGMAKQVISTLNAVTGLAETLSLLARSDKSRDKTGTYTALIRDSSDKLINSLQQRISGGTQPELFHNLRYGKACVIDIVESAVHFMEARCEAKHQDIDIVATVDRLEAEFDPQALRQALVDLIDNAHKFSPAGAPIRVTVDDEAEAIRITVVDQGVGMQDDALQQIFALPLGVDAPEGGLQVARNIMAMHGGTCEVESFPAWGTTVVLTLPRRRPTLN